MTFDMQRGRDLLRAYAPGFARPCEIEALSAALDEIERLRGLAECIDCGKSLFESDPVMGEDGVYRLGAVFFDPGYDGDHENPSAPARAVSICQDCQKVRAAKRTKDLEELCDGLLGNCNALRMRCWRLEADDIKKRTALKCMRAKLRVRGKALIEERKKYILVIHPNASPEYGTALAERELRQEGKI